MKKTHLFLFGLILTLGCSCVTREEIDAHIWQNNFNAKELKEICEQNPILLKIGFKRVLDDGSKEVVSICAKESNAFFGMSQKDFNTLLDKALPKPTPES